MACPVLTLPDSPSSRLADSGLSESCGFGAPAGVAEPPGDSCTLFSAGTFPNQ